MPGMAALLVALTTLAQPAGPQEGEAGPLVTKVGVYLLDVQDIRDADQTVSVDLLITLRWNNPSLASPRSRRLPVEPDWNPRVQLMGERNLSRLMPEEVTVDPSGTVEYLQRFVGNVSIRTDLSRFPFDRHDLTLSVTSVAWQPQGVRFELDGKRIGRAASFTIPDWTIEGGTAAAGEFRLLEGGRGQPLLTYTFRATRKPLYNLLKIIMPLVLVVVMSWTVFWLDPRQTEVQIGVSTASILTLIAYWFVLGGLLPEISYLTSFDKFNLGSTVLVFASLIVAVVTSMYGQSERMEKARAVNRWCRILSPVCYLLLFAACFLL
jgi:hypothetical protein